jgi:hypothetical protein
MASISLINQLLNGIADATTRGILSRCFEEAIKQARIGDSDKAENFAWFQVESTTHATANTEFSVVHGMETAPSRFLPSLRLDVSGAQLVPLTVSRVSDSKRAYFKSSSTSAVFGGHFEVWIAALGLAQMCCQFLREVMA